MPLRQHPSATGAAVRSGNRPDAACREPGRAWPALAACAAVTEATYVAAFLLPLRIDRVPPSLHTNLARTYGLDPAGLAGYLAVVAALFAAYWAALRASRAAPRRAVFGVIAASAVFMTTLLWIHPTYSSDVFHYVATARVAFVHGENPHRVPPEAFSDDPMMPLSGWKSLPSPYGAGWSWLSVVPYVASGGLSGATGAVLAFKALAVLCTIGAVAGVAVAAERLRPGAGAVAAVALGWNPLILIHFAGDGHNDAAMLLFLAWGIVALTARRWTAALVLFAAAALIKPAAGIALLFAAIALLRAGRRRETAAAAVFASVLALLLYLPWWDGIATLQPIIDEGGYFTNTPASVLRSLLSPRIGNGTAELLTGGVARLLLLAAALRLAWHCPLDPTRIMLRIGVTYALAVVVFGTWYQPWYVSWALVFLSSVAVARPVAAPVILALTVGGLLVPVAVNFIAGISGRPANDALVEALAVALILGPLVPVALNFMPRRRPHGPEIDRPVFSAR